MTLQDLSWGTGTGCLRGEVPPCCPHSQRASTGVVMWPPGISCGDVPWDPSLMTATVTVSMGSPSSATRYWGVPPLPPGLEGGWSPPNLAVYPPQLSEPQGFPGFLLFLCRLLSPILQTYGRAVEFLERPPWPQPGRTPPTKWGTPWDSLGPLKPPGGGI